MQKFLKNHVFSLLAWLVILVISLVCLPNVDELARDHANVSLPSNVQSEVAKTIQNDWGPSQKNTYQTAIVFNKAKGKLTASDKQAINATAAKMRHNKQDYGIKQMLAPDENVAARKQLQSKDGTTWIMQLNVAKSHAPINEVESELNQAAKTAGLKTYVTGSNVLENAFTSSIQAGIKKTEVITVVFIFIVLVLVFKSPIVPLISLLTVGVSFIVSFALVTNLVKQVDFPFSNFTQVFMIIVLFGIGTDYNILLYDKFKENLAAGLDRYQATRDALRIAGKTILYSGGSLLIGFLALGLAKFSIYQSAVGVAIGVAVLLLVLLTLNPFFMSVLGGKMFWPVKHFPAKKENKLWHGLSKASLSHPLIYLLVLAAVTIPFAVMYTGHLNYDDAAEVADTVPAKKGLLVVQKHFSKGMAEPATLYIKSKHRLDNEADLKLLDQLTKQLQFDKSVALATSATQPYGEALDQLYVNNQLNTVTNGVGEARTGLNKVSKATKKLAKGANTLANGTTQLQSGTSTLQSGAGQVQLGSQQVAAGASQLNSSLSGASNSVTAGLADSIKKAYQTSLVKNVNQLPGLTMQQKAMIMGTAAKSLQSAMTSSQVTAASNALANQMAQMQAATGQLAAASGQVASGASSVTSGIGQVNSNLGQLANGSSQLAAGTPQVKNGVDQVNSALGQGESYLTGLAKSPAAATFYVPKEYLKSGMFKEALTAYLSADKKSAMITIIFNTDPSSDQTVAKAQDLSLMARNSLHGTRLAKSTVAMGGESAKLADTKEVAGNDFVRTAAIMLIGIGIALIFVTRSLLQPVYILGTLLIAYICSLSLNQWLVKGLLGQDLLTWNTPFFSFIMLIALGVDYSIFLMIRYREIREKEHLAVSKALLKACGIIGGVVISSVIILAGTFAALIPSAIPTLIEVAMTVITGLVILVFILPMTLSASVKLTYEGFSWGKKKKASK